MTRMVDEQRTQIGVLKALGYSNSQIVGKYMFYSGSAAFLGAV
jgi:putative ABC transport system permease protein